jgi:phosphoglycerate dehydrogenase-like enzyme
MAQREKRSPTKLSGPSNEIRFADIILRSIESFLAYESNDAGRYNLCPRRWDKWRFPVQRCDLLGYWAKTTCRAALEPASPGSGVPTTPRHALKIAILDDYQNVALSMADWSTVAQRADITVFSDHIDQADALVERLLPFDVICVMRERTPLRRDIIERLPRLRFVASTGPRNISIDMAAANERGIVVANTGYRSTPTIELTWALILASARHLVVESNSIRAGGWQTSIGHELDGRVLGVVGLGNVGGQVARIGRAFGMKIIAWSQNLTPEAAAAAGAELVMKDDLFRQADVVTIHLILSERTRALVGAAELALMKPTAQLVNTSRGPIVHEQALVEALRNRAIAGAAIDVFDTEPLPEKHAFRSIENLVATPHIGYVAEDLYRTFYGDVAAAIGAWIEKQALGR